MPLKSDFDKMTLDELTPIVSMRPGKEYTKEELRAARMAFMEKLGCANPEIETEEEPETDAFTESVPDEAEILTPAAELPEEPIMDIAEEISVSAPIIETVSETPVADDPAPLLSSEVVADTEEVHPPVLVETEENSETATPSEVEEAEKTEETEDADMQKTEDEITPSAHEEFIMKTDSRLARFLYLLYAYFLLPALAIESISLLVISVGTSVAASNTPFIVINVICAAVYAMVISLSWHQFLARTSLGLLLSRTLICVCILRGFLMLLSGTNVFMGIIFIALSVLFLIYFIGYDTMFTIKSQKKQRVR